MQNVIISCSLWLSLLLVAAAQDSVVVFNEIHYHPNDGETEWVELHNQMAVDVDLSGWRLRGGITYDFPDETILEGGGYLVIASDPADFDGQVLGPFEGRLDNAGDTIRLEDRSTIGTVPGGQPRHRVMDLIRFDDESPWPTEPDGTGVTLAKIDPDGGTSFLANWAASAVVGGTPGENNFPEGTPGNAIAPHVPGPVVINEIMYHQRPFHATPEIPGEFENTPFIDTNAAWKFQDSGSAPPEGWQTAVNDWPESTAPFGIGLDSPVATIQTPLSLRSPTVSFVSAHYFNQEFLLETEEPDAFHDIVLRLLVDDGAIAYLNGHEIFRTNLPEGPVSERTSAQDEIGNPQWITESISPSLLEPGRNVLAVELHQNFTLFKKSDDGIFAAELVGRVATKAPTPAEPHRESDEEWLELFNRTGEVVDLSGWELQGGVRYQFPEQTMLDPGAYLVVDTFEGTLSNGGERLALVDSSGNSVDEVRYRDRGQWASEADGYGASLELRDPDADNRIGTAWAPSDESLHSEWHTYSYEGVAEEDGIGTSLYHELVVGMLDAGELLLDDVSVIEDPDGAAVELMQHGDFEQATVDTVPDHWLAVGTHGHSRVIADPDSVGNQVFHVIATGATEDKHNQLSTVYDNDRRVRIGRTYRISFRAKWLSGSNLLNTRLYFNFLQRSTRLVVPDGGGGTPGEPNSRLIENLGPTLQGLHHEPVLPVANEPIAVTIRAADPDGITSMKLTYAVNGGTIFSGGTHVVDMQPIGEGLFQATIPGRKVGDLVRIHVTATDTLGGITQFPVQGADARAMFEIVDDAALSEGPHRFRVLMEKKDRELRFQDAVRMSNDRVLGTVIYKEIPYYNVGIRLKGSAWARNNVPFQGLNFRFDPERPFRGVHKTVALERDPGKGEILAHHLFYAAGGKLPSIYSDVVDLDFDQPSLSGRVLLLMARTSSPFLGGSFDNASEGTVYNLELLYTPQATIDRQPESAKRPFPYTHDKGRYDFRVMGPDKEAYRWGFQMRSNRDRDHYDPILRVAEAMEFNGTRFDQAMARAMDIDQWARAFAMMALNGNDDFYTRLWEHNLRLYHRPEDDRLIALPWDFDRAWRLGASSPLIGGLNNANTVVNLPKVLERPQNLRRFQGHLLDLLDSVYNEDYVDRWADHYGALFRSNLGSVTSYVRSRANFARRQLPAEVSFAIVTNGGKDFTIDRPLVTLQGRGWINVHAIHLAGQPAALATEWSNASSWNVEVPVSPGPNQITLQAYDLRGNEVGSASINVTGTSNEVLANAANVVLSEIHYHPADSLKTEFLELWNRSESTVILDGARLADGVVFEFEDAVLAAGERAAVVENLAAFSAQYPNGVRILGEYTGRLNNAGERLLLLGANGGVITELEYGDTDPWPTEADGDGPSLVLTGNDPGDANSWGASEAEGGDPGGGADPEPGLTYLAWKEAQGVRDDFADEDGDSLSNLLEYAFGGVLGESSLHLLPTLTATNTLEVMRRAAVDDVTLAFESSQDLSDWQTEEGFEFDRAVAVGNGLVRETYRMDRKEATVRYVRLRVMIED